MGSSPGGTEDPRKKIEQLDEARRYLDDLERRKELERDRILQAVRAELDTLEKAYVQRLQDAEAAVTELESEVKAAVLQLGQSVRVGDVQVVYSRGRVTWDSQALTRYAKTNPEVEQFRKVGEPSVAVRYKQAENQDEPA